MIRCLLPVLILVACGDSDGSKDAVPDTQADTEDTQTNPTVITGCLSGQLRDYNNAAFPNAPIRAVELEHCGELDADTSFGDGTFCLENIPIQEIVELQTVFSERCTWEHALQIQAPAKGNCGQPETCFNLDAWFECEGNPISCK